MWRGGRVLILVAHPDDETLAFGGELAHWPDCVICHTTDGSPQDPSDSVRAGFHSTEEYREARRQELKCALATVGGRDLRSFALADQQSWRDLASLTLSVRDLIRDVRPAVVLTHPYEGGHPDHDGAAFAVQRACTLMARDAPERIEGAFYHRARGVFQVNEFLPGPAVTAMELDEKARERKTEMLACFLSQERTLAPFSRTTERYRRAPEYRFDQPPHGGLLNYETLGWGITSGAWIEAARQADQQLSK